MSWQLMLGLVPWVFVLACPLAMWWMMRSMSHGQSCGNEGRREEGALQPVPVRSQEAEIRALREHVARLEAQEQRARR